MLSCICQRTLHPLAYSPIRSQMYWIFAAPAHASVVLIVNACEDPEPLNGEIPVTPGGHDGPGTAHVPPLYQGELVPSRLIACAEIVRTPANDGLKLTATFAAPMLPPARYPLMPVAGTLHWLFCSVAPLPLAALDPQLVPSSLSKSQYSISARLWTRRKSCS